MIKSFISGKVIKTNTTKGTNPRTYATLVTEGATFNLETNVQLELNKSFLFEVLSIPDVIVRTYSGDSQAQTILRPYLITGIAKQ